MGVGRVGSGSRESLNQDGVVELPRDFPRLLFPIALLRHAPQDGLQPAAGDALAGEASGVAEGAAVDQAANAALDAVAAPAGAEGSGGRDAGAAAQHRHIDALRTMLAKNQDIFLRLGPQLQHVYVERDLMVRQMAGQAVRPNAILYAQKFDKDWFEPTYEGPQTTRAKNHVCKCCVKTCDVWLEKAQAMDWPHRLRLVAVNGETYWDAFDIEDTITVWHSQGRYPGPRTWGLFCVKHAGLYPKMEVFAQSPAPGYFKLYLDDDFEFKWQPVYYQHRQTGVAFQKIHHNRSSGWWSGLTEMAKTYVLQYEGTYGHTWNPLQAHAAYKDNHDAEGNLIDIC